MDKGLVEGVKAGLGLARGSLGRAEGWIRGG